MTAPEQQILAAAFVDEFRRLHVRGVQPFRPGPRPSVEEWEAWCADVALDEAGGVLQLYREAASRAGYQARDIALRGKPAKRRTRR